MWRIASLAWPAKTCLPPPNIRVATRHRPLDEHQMLLDPTSGPGRFQAKRRAASRPWPRRGSDLHGAYMTLMPDQLGAHGIWLVIMEVRVSFMTFSGCAVVFDFRSRSDLRLSLLFVRSIEENHCQNALSSASLVDCYSRSRTTRWLGER